MSCFFKELSDYVSISKDDVKPLFTEKTKSIVWGMQNKAVQAMLDFDHVCSRKQPSVVAMIYPFTYIFRHTRDFDSHKKSGRICIC